MEAFDTENIGVRGIGRPKKKAKRQEMVAESTLSFDDEEVTASSSILPCFKRTNFSNMCYR